MKIDFAHFSADALFAQTDFEKKVLQFLEDWFSASDTVMVQTSGSTGTPKVFAIDKDRMRQSAQMTCDKLNLKEGDTALLCLPVDYISGKMMVVRAVERKLKLIVMTPSAQPVDQLNNYIDFCAMSPLQVENSLGKLHLIKNLIIGGAAVSESLKNKITQTLKNPTSQTLIYETYGMSETLSHIALKEIYPILDEYFKVLDDVQISLDNRNCLEIFAPQLNPNHLATNDLVEIKNEKEFKFLGRIDNVINSAGLKIYPEQLEILVKKDLSNEVVFFGIVDELLGQKLIMVIEGKENDFAGRQLDQIKYPTKNHQPKEILFLSKFPRLPNGKINRRELLNLTERKS